jgi:Ni,Fe-hydrogenase maturation factor
MNEPSLTIAQEMQTPVCEVETSTVIGIGSSHGEDIAGWEVIQQLRSHWKLPRHPHPAQKGSHTKATLRTAAVPHDILDWLAPSIATHIVDARLGGEPSIGRFRVQACEGLKQVELFATKNSGSPEPRLTISELTEGLRSGSTHQFDLLSVLELSAALGMLPKQLILWTVPIAHTKADEISESTRLAIHECARLIAEELADA